MKFNPPSTVRTFLYVMGVAINTFVGVLLTSDIKLSVYVLAAIAAYNAVVALMAGANVTPDEL